MSKIDEIESWKLHARISDLEHQLSSSGASAGSSTSMLVQILNEAKKQLTGLQMKEQNHHDEERRKADAQLVAVVQLVAQETALNQRERQQYGAFIQKEFFTQNDFTALEDFYANAWDRLTDGGKAQMSHRVWEGVRRDEYEFSELPNVVREKEALSLYEALANEKNRTPELSRIPANDTHDFVTAWDNGRKDEAFKILERPSFAENVAVSPHIISKSDAKGRLATNQAELTAGLTGFATKAASTDDVSSGAALSEALLGNLEAMPKAKSSNEQRLVENYPSQER